METTRLVSFKIYRELYPVLKDSHKNHRAIKYQCYVKKLIFIQNSRKGLNLMSKNEQRNQQREQTA